MLPVVDKAVRCGAEQGLLRPEGGRQLAVYSSLFAVQLRSVAGCGLHSRLRGGVVTGEAHYSGVCPCVCGIEHPAHTIVLTSHRSSHRHTSPSGEPPPQCPFLGSPSVLRRNRANRSGQVWHTV